MTHRLFTACLGTETNSFSPIPTGLSVFEAAMLVRGGRHGAQPSLLATPTPRATCCSACAHSSVRTCRCWPNWTCTAT